MKRRSVIITAVLALFVGMAFVLGYRASNGGGSLVVDASVAMGIAIASLVAFGAVMLLWKVLDARPWENRISSGEVEHPIRACVLAGLVMLVCWIPVLLAGFPGFFNYDAGVADPLMQWAQVEQGVLNAHHPIVHTVFLEYTVKLGMMLFGSFNAGVCVSVAIQAIIVAALLSFSLYCLLEDGMTRAGFLASAAYFSLDPIVGMFALCTTKDTLFSAVVVVFCLLISRLARYPRRASRAGLVRLAIAVTMCGWFVCVMRSNALVAVIVMAPLLFAVMHGRARKALTAGVVTALALSLAWLGPFSAAIGVQPSPIGKWNAMGIPMQQVARCAFDQDVSPKDRQHVKDVMGKDINYKQNNSDVARDVFCWGTASGRQIVELYAEMGAKYPGVYLEAALLHTEDAWSPFAMIDAYNFDDGYTSVFNYRTMEPGEMKPKLLLLSEALEWISTKQGPERIPGLHFLISIACQLFIMLLCLNRAAITRDKGALCFTVPLAVLTLSSLFGPCMLIRYYLYLFFTLPMMLHFLIHAHKEETASC